MRCFRRFWWMNVCEEHAELFLHECALFHLLVAHGAVWMLLVATCGTVFLTACVAGNCFFFFHEMD